MAAVGMSSKEYYSREDLVGKGSKVMSVPNTTACDSNGSY